MHHCCCPSSSAHQIVEDNPALIKSSPDDLKDVVALLITLLGQPAAAALISIDAQVLGRSTVEIRRGLGALVGLLGPEAVVAAARTNKFLLRFCWGHRVDEVVRALQRMLGASAGLHAVTHCPRLITASAERIASNAQTLQWMVGVEGSQQVARSHPHLLLRDSQSVLQVRDTLVRSFGETGAADLVRAAPQLLLADPKFIPMRLAAFEAMLGEEGILEEVRAVGIVCVILVTLIAVATRTSPTPHRTLPLQAQCSPLTHTRADTHTLIEL